MASNNHPLLAQNDSAEQSPERELAEEEELLTGRRKSLPAERRRQWREVALFGWAVIATVFAVILAIIYDTGTRGRGAGGARPEGKRNLIFMVSDGMGPTSLSLTRAFQQYEQGLPYNDGLVLDKYTIGQSRTRSTSSLITDSAAGATAFSCAAKSYNGAISVLPDHTPCGTVMEAAKAAGYMTGLVVTTRITDATPACFASHVNVRSEEDRIAEQLLGDLPLGQSVDLMLGAGRCHFLPNTTEGSCRGDDKDLVAVAKEKGFSYIDNRRGFDNLAAGAKLPLLGLFADHDIPYEIDRQQEKQTYPALVEMARKAMTSLSEATRGHDKGFFLMIEGSRIDHAGHANDPVAQVHEVIAYDKAFQSVLNFLENDKTQGILVATSDHETGGVATAKQLGRFDYPKYAWYPGVLANASHSVEWLTHDYARHLETGEAGATSESYIRDALPRHLGIHDASADEISDLVDDPDHTPYFLADMISRRSQTGWSTHGHSGADVNIYASDHDAARELMGNVENTDVGLFLKRYLDVEEEVEESTRKLREMKGDWMGGDGGATDGPSHEVEMDHYEGDFRKHRRRVR
ncbi:MAG: hypothetical protein Q9159_004433 [Coniocarpon cinnabarinum]